MSRKYNTKSSAHVDRAFCLPAPRTQRVLRACGALREWRRLRRQLGGAGGHRRWPARPVGPALGLALGCELGLELVQGIEGLKRREGVEVESFNALHQLLLLCHFRFGCSGTGLLFTHLSL